VARARPLHYGCGMADLRPRRSALFLPASNPRAIAKARTLDADVVILDLEDAVAPEAKPDARTAAISAMHEDFGRRERVIRANALDTEWGVADLTALRDADVDAVLLPKVSDVATLRRARALLGPDIPLWIMVETCRAILDLRDIAAAAAEHGLTAFVAGTNDLAKELRCRPGDARAPLIPALAHIVTAARAYGLVALDGVSNAIDDPAKVEAECEQGRDLGFDGKTLIHPSQIDPANRVFAPDADEVAWARTILAAFDAPEAQGKGAIRIEGRMVELLHRDEARRTVALAEAIAG
jgi:citrate lyase subunit beta / citryl-CoA lyase